jgi:hypothetical protein
MTACNIDSKGRWIRGINSLLLLAAAAIVWWMSWPTWIAIVLLAAGLFSGYEALKGWCALRAMGIKTKY